MEGLFSVGVRDSEDEVCEAVVDEKVPKDLRISIIPCNKRALNYTGGPQKLYPPEFHSD